MNKGLDFVFVEMPVQRAELEWRDFLTTCKETPAAHRVSFIPAAGLAIAGSFLVSNEIRCSGLVQAFRRLWNDRGLPTAKLLNDFLQEQSVPLASEIIQNAQAQPAFPRE